MILLRGVLTAILTAGVLFFTAERAGANHIGHSLPAMEPAGLIFATTSVDEMTPEMRKAYIRGIQEELAAHRYDPGPTDGLLGPMTHRAIRKVLSTQSFFFTTHTKLPPRSRIRDTSTPGRVTAAEGSPDHSRRHSSTCL